MFSETIHLTTEIEVSENLNWNYVENNDVFNFYANLGVTYFFRDFKYENILPAFMVS